MYICGSTWFELSILKRWSLFDSPNPNLIHMLEHPIQRHTPLHCWGIHYLNTLPSFTLAWYTVVRFHPKVVKSQSESSTKNPCQPNRIKFHNTELQSIALGYGARHFSGSSPREAIPYLNQWTVIHCLCIWSDHVIITLPYQKLSWFFYISGWFQKPFLSFISLGFSIVIPRLQHCASKQTNPCLQFSCTFKRIRECQ